LLFVFWNKLLLLIGLVLPMEGLAKIELLFKLKLLLFILFELKIELLLLLNWFWFCANGLLLELFIKLVWFPGLNKFWVSGLFKLLFGPNNEDEELLFPKGFKLLALLWGS